MTSGLTRRQFVLSGALAATAIPFGRWLVANGSPQPSPRIRYGLQTPEGKKNLAIYTDGFFEMQDLLNNDPIDPRGLAFQYRIHKYPDNWDYLVNDAEKQARMLGRSF
jgi:hypothetical protein